MTALTIEPITPCIGATVRIAADDVLKDGVPDKLLAALNRYNVLVFPEIHLSDEAFVALTAAMGDMHDLGATDDKSGAADKGVYRIALDKDDRTQLDFVRGNDYWHMDGTSYNVPGKGTFLKCESPPSAGGETDFANLFAAWDALPDDRRAALEPLEVKHCMAAVGRLLYDAPTEEDFARWDGVFPHVAHPLVWHQKDGRTSLLIGSTADEIVGLDRDEGRALLDELLDWCTGTRFTYRHVWKKGDMVMFNNPGLLHRSRPYTADAGRVMHRTTLKGTEAIV